MKKQKKQHWVFVCIKYSKFWSTSLGHFIKHKPLISEECSNARLVDLQRFHSVIEYLDDSIDVILDNQINFGKSSEKLLEKLFKHDEDVCIEWKELKSEMKEVIDDVKNIKRDLSMIKSILNKLHLK